MNCSIKKKKKIKLISSPLQSGIKLETFPELWQKNLLKFSMYGQIKKT